MLLIKFNSMDMVLKRQKGQGLNVETEGYNP